MESALRKLPGLCWCLALAAALLPAARAFPPAPPHTIHGVVRDHIGNPLNDGAEVILEASSGVRVRTFVFAQEESTLNYKLEVPMDAGLTADLYSPTALTPAAPFRLRVRVGQTTFLPMEMIADFSKLGVPGAVTRIDLTLGVDADGNGLPDAWERAVAAFLGRTGPINPNDPYPGTGMTFREVYLAGTYAMDPADGFALNIINSPGTTPRLAFTAVKGRTYRVQGAGRLGASWASVAIRPVAGGAEAAPVQVYQPTETRRVEVEVPNDASAQFYRLIVE